MSLTYVLLFYHLLSGTVLSQPSVQVRRDAALTEHLGHGIEFSGSNKLNKREIFWSGICRTAILGNFLMIAEE
jgi:hypothetical protein